MRARVLAPATFALVLGAVSCEDSFTPEFVASIRLDPDSVHISAGQTVVFTAIPTSEAGVELPDRAKRVRWRVNRTSVATIDGEVGEELGVTAVAMGDATLTATLGRAVTTADVFVQPPGLASIEIVPPIVEVSRGQRSRVESRLYDEQGALLSPEGFRIAWKIVDTRIGFVGSTAPHADLWARRVGTTSVRLIVGHLSTSIPFIVR